jgi:glutaredoxin
VSAGMTPKVIVYSTPLCAPCEALKRFLRANAVAFVAKDLMMDEDAAEYIESKNIRSTPVLQIDDQLYCGKDLSPERLEQLLAL